VELSIFVCMGFGLLAVWPAVVASLSATALQLLLLGGAAYVVGIIFFILGEYKPIYHVIWHLFVVLGALLHWFDIYFFIVPTVLPSIGTVPSLDSLAQQSLVCNITRNSF
jgi:channel protein (hemolysin III family)